MAGTSTVLLAGLKSPGDSLVSEHFSKAGHRVLSAADIVDAAQKISAHTIDLIYLQASTDDQAVHELHDFAGRFAPVPIVLLCDRPAEHLVLDAWHAGAADVLFHPITPQSLTASFERCAKRDVHEPGRPAPASGRFFYLDETGKECRAQIISPKFSIGRASGNSLVLGGMGISRFHAEVSVQNGEYRLHDLGSKQGTYVNGVRIEQTRLSEGDHVQLGGSAGRSLVFHEGDLLQSLLGSSESKPEISLPVRGFKEVGMLFAAFRALSSVPVLDDLLGLVVDTAIELTGAERGFIMLKEKNDELIFRCARDNQKHTLDGSCFLTSRRVPFDVFKTGRSVMIKDLNLEDQNEAHSATRRLGLRSISCVPLRYLSVHDTRELSSVGTAETIGVLYIDNTNVSSGFSNARIDALQTLASEAAMAIYNARLYKASQDKLRMDEQLAIAREIQQSLLPQPDKDLPYVRARSQNLPCYAVGGDYYDYFDLEEGRFGFAVGDVAGKGMPAALTASLIQGILCAHMLFKAPMPSMISSVNRTLAQRGAGNRFVTFFFGILDPDGNCRYVNAGHNPPLLLGRNGSIRELTVGGMVLGLFPEAQYEYDTVELQPGDHLVLFTDGVIEALNAAGEEFGMERLIALLRANAQSSAGEILGRLRGSVLSFSANTAQHDDITMMILGYRESQD